MWRSVCGVDAPHTAQWLEYQLWVVRASWDLKSQMTTSALSHNTPIELQMNPRREKWSQQIDCIFRMVCISTQAAHFTLQTSFTWTPPAPPGREGLVITYSLSRFLSQATVTDQLGGIFFCLISCYLAGCPIQSPKMPIKLSSPNMEVE